MSASVGHVEVVVHPVLDPAVVAALAKLGEAIGELVAAVSLDAVGELVAARAVEGEKRDDDEDDGPSSSCGECGVVH